MMSHVTSTFPIYLTKNEAVTMFPTKADVNITIKDFATEIKSNVISKTDVQNQFALKNDVNQQFETLSDQFQNIAFTKNDAYAQFLKKSDFNKFLNNPVCHVVDSGRLCAKGEYVNGISADGLQMNCCKISQ